MRDPDPNDAPDEPSSPQAPDTRRHRALDWVKRSAEHLAMGFACMVVVFPIIITADVLRLLSRFPSLAVDQHYPVFFLSHLVGKTTVTAYAIQAALIYAITIWLVLTRHRRTSAPTHTPHPIVLTMVLTCTALQPLRVLLLDFSVASIVEASFLFVVYSVLPVMLATAWTFERSEGFARRAMKWGVVFALMAAIGVLNPPTPPHANATLQERDAWAREHMGEYYEVAVADISNNPLTHKVMGDTFRIGPIDAANGSLKLTRTDVVSLKGHLLVDDGRRAAKCLIDYEFTPDGGIAAPMLGHTCTRDGVTFRVNHWRPEKTHVEAFDAHGARQIEELWPEFMDKLLPVLDEGLAKLQVERSQPPTYTKIWISHEQGEEDPLVLRATALIEEGSTRFICEGGANFHADGTRSLPEGVINPSGRVFACEREEPAAP